MRLSNTLLPMAILVTTLASSPALAQPASATPCTLKKEVYTCDKASFAAVLKQAKTIAIEAQPRDHDSPVQLKDLAASLKKTVAPETADLTFRLTRAESTGISVGPAGAPLATLCVYGAATDGHRGPLLWLETFTGQPDLRWPSIVRATLQQFQEDFQ